MSCEVENMDRERVSKFGLVGGMFALYFVFVVLAGLAVWVGCSVIALGL